MRLRLLLFLTSLPLLILCQSSWNMNLLGSFDYDTNHNTKCNDIWGWEDGNGNEYALVGLENGFSCIDVTNPTVPIEMFYISDINSTWRDIKTWGQYAYITTEADAGLLIVDLSDLTGNTYWHVSQFTNPTDTISFTSSHNIYIDENGVAYIFGLGNNGTPVANGGVVFLDVNSNPTAPSYLGQWNGQYIHDGMTRGDTMYAGCIYAGKLFVVDVSNKSNPQTIGQHATPNNFTHNAWVSDDGDYVFTTDEKSDAYLAAYDISNINNIQEVDRIQSNPGSNSIPHNTHVDGNFLITSYYRDGTTVHDITYPNHMVQVAYYDSYAGSGNGFNGCWGTYPFLSSGNIISSDRDSYNGKGILNIYGRAFQQACYLMGNVTDAINGNNLASTDISILNTTTTANANIIGAYQTAVVDSGTYQVVFSKNGYISDTLSVLLDNGIMTTLNTQLYPIPITCPVELFISEYGEGSGYNKYLEIYNGTGISVDLSLYEIWKVTNGGIWPEYTLSLSGILAHNDVYIIYSSNSTVNSTISSAGDTTWGYANWNGNDAVGLAKNGVLIDAIGTDGPAPSIGWDVAGDSVATKNHTLVRDSSVISGNTNWIISAGSNSTNSEWIVLPQNDWNDIGQHNIINCQFIFGCTDSLACNYDSLATTDDSSCIYLNLNITILDSISCCGATDGKLAAIPIGGTPFYSFLWSPVGAVTDIISGLAAGNYYVTVTDYNGCTVNDSITITEPPCLTTSIVSTNESCYGANDGSASAVAYGGTPPYTYFWSNGQTSANINGLSAGTYICQVISYCGMSTSDTVTITGPSVFSLSVSSDTILCYGGTANATAYPSGGVAPYLYNWSNNATTQSTSLLAGISTITVTDTNGCTVSDTIIVYQNDSVNFSTNITNISCFGANDGSIDLNIITGGQSPFQYSKDNGSTFQNSNQFSSLSSGNYNLVIMDATPCLTNANVTITEPPILSVTSTTNDATCYGYCDGTAILTISGGTPTYSQNWNGNSPNALCAGTYNCTITDANACSISHTITIFEPTVLSGQILQNANDLDALVSGGTPTYSYLWNTNETTGTITPTHNGTFWLIITDNNGCISDTIFILYDNLPNGIIENSAKRNLIEIIDVLGRETLPNKERQTIFYIYDDGTVEKRIIIE